MLLVVLLPAQVAEWLEILLSWPATSRPQSMHFYPNPFVPHCCLHVSSDSSVECVKEHTPASAGLPLSHAFGSGQEEAPVIRQWGRHIVSKVMSAFPGRTHQLPTPSQASPQPAEAASQAASWAAAQPAAPPQQLQSPSHLPAECHASSAQNQTQTAALDLQPPAQLSAAMLSGSVHHGLEEAPSPQAAVHFSSGNADSASAPEAAMPSGSQGPAIPASQQQTHTPRDGHCTPSILQDLRDAAAQDCVHQPQGPPSPTAGLGGQQATMEPVQPSQQAFPELQSSQETTSMQAYRLSTATQSAGALPLAPEEAAASHADPPCSGLQAPPAVLPLAKAPDTMPVELGTTAGSDEDRQLVVAGQTVANGSAAFAEHSDGLSTAPVLEAAVTAVEEKQPVVRSQRLSEKKAAAACAQAAAQAAADAVVQAAALREKDMLAASVKQTGFGLASRVEVASSSMPLVLAECLASNRSKRVPGGDPLEVSPPSAPRHPGPPAFCTTCHAPPSSGTCLISMCASRGEHLAPVSPQSHTAISHKTGGC